MELHKIIQKLYLERAKLDETLAALDQLLLAGAAKKERVKKRRGRTSMDADERQEVSKRMREYWARRRKQRSAEDGADKKGSR